MANMIDYVLWRGDIDFSVSSLNAVDNLILCQITYLNYEGIVSSEFLKKGPTLREVAAKFRADSDFEKRSDVGAMINKKTVELLMLASESERFGSLRMSGYLNKIDEIKEEQFCAVTYTCDSLWNFIVYRGTDDTIVGWKEDFNLGYMDVVPAQTDALSYLEKASKVLKGKIIVGGHSKGGNLAIYSASMSDEKIQKRITDVYNNDGPGFKKEFFETSSYAAIRNKEHTFVPQLSIIGMLFSHSDAYCTVESDAQGLYQHDPFSWHVMSKEFVELSDTNEQSKFIGKTVNEWINALNREQRELFIETVFGILRGTNATTNTELTENIGESLMKMLKAMTKLDAQTRDATFKILQLLFKNARENVGELRRNQS